MNRRAGWSRSSGALRQRTLARPSPIGKGRAGRERPGASLDGKVGPIVERSGHRCCRHDCTLQGHVVVFCQACASAGDEALNRSDLLLRHLRDARPWVSHPLLPRRLLAKQAVALRACHRPARFSCLFQPPSAWSHPPSPRSLSPSHLISHAGQRWTQSCPCYRTLLSTDPRLGAVKDVFVKVGKSRRCCAWLLRLRARAGRQPRVRRAGSVSGGDRTSGMRGGG
jgi:hypothetical protein